MEDIAKQVIAVIAFILTYLGYNYVQKVKAAIQAEKDQGTIKKILKKYEDGTVSNDTALDNNNKRYG